MNTPNGIRTRAAGVKGRCPRPLDDGGLHLQGTAMRLLLSGECRDDQLARHADGDPAVSWRIRGSYFESCNCDAICPCRRVDGVPGGRSTHGVCMGVLTWLIETGEAEGTDLAGLPVALACRYDDDEPGSPWTWLLYLEVAAAPEQQAALTDIFSGRLGGDALEHFPWAWKKSELVGGCGWLSSRSTTRDDANDFGSGTASASGSMADTAARRRSAA